MDEESGESTKKNDVTGREEEGQILRDLDELDGGKQGVDSGDKMKHIGIKNR